jgi:hypothetical protein
MHPDPNPLLLVEKHEIDQDLKSGISFLFYLKDQRIRIGVFISW